MEVNKDEMIEKCCNKRFRMGENVYKSEKEITMLVVIEVKNRDNI